MRLFNFRQNAIASFFVMSMAIAVVSGCKSPEAALAGKWSGPGQMPALTLNADKSFTQGDGQMGATGSWSLADKKVTIKIEKIGGKPADQAIDDLAKMAAKTNPGAVTADVIAKAKASAKSAVFNLSADGKSMTSETSGPMGQITYTKADK